MRLKQISYAESIHQSDWPFARQVAMTHYFDQINQQMAKYRDWPFEYKRAQDLELLYGVQDLDDTSTRHRSASEYVFRDIMF